MLIDILVGALLSLGVGYFTQTPLTPLWILAGALFALLPDIDFLIEYAKRGRVGGTTLGAHRVLTHIPLLFVLPAVLLYIFGSSAFALLFTLCIIWHFVHDSQGMGYGYRMFYPFSNRFYKFFSDKEGQYRYDIQHLVVSWTREEVDALHKKYGNDNWIQDHIRYHSKKWFSFFSPRV